MTFRIIHSKGGGGSGARHPLTFSSLSLGNAGYGGRFSFSKELVNQLSWTNGDCITVGIGEGKDTGWVRLSNGDLTGFKLRGATRDSSRSILTVTALSDREKHRAVPAEHKIKNGALFVKLPDWAL